MKASLRYVILTGGAALLAATAIDTFAVVGRHVGLPVPGSIEMMQAVVLVSGIIAMLVATVENAHARVKLVIDRLPADRRALADRVSNIFTLAFFIALLVGSSWIAWDLRDVYEQSELLGIPWMALRIVAGLVLLATCGVLVRRVLVGSDVSGGTPSNAVMEVE